MYNPQIQYRGDQYIAQGMDAMSDSVSKGIHDFYDTKKKSDSYQAMIPSLVGQKLPDGTPLITEEEAAKAMKGSMGAKEGVIASANAKLHNYYLNAQTTNLQANTGHTNMLTNYYGAATEAQKLQNGAAQQAQHTSASNASNLNSWAALLNGSEPPLPEGQAPVTPQAPPMVAPAQPLGQPMPPAQVNPMSQYYGSLGQ